MGIRSRKLGRLSPKQVKYVRALVSKPEISGTGAAREAGYSYPAEASYKNLRNEDVRAEFKRLMDANPALTKSGLLATLADGLLADKPDPSGPGSITDYAVRHKYLDTALKLTGALNPVSSEDTHALVQINLAADSLTSGVIMSDGSKVEPGFLAPKSDDVGSPEAKDAL